MWVDVGPSTKCGVELRLSVVSAWRWSYVSLLSVRGGGAEGFHSGCIVLELELEGL